jgi:tetratricopeptide (TPR) repeat protein
LYRSGRQADALAAVSRLREVLAGELGLDPSPEVRSLEARILRQDPDLEAAAIPAWSPVPTSATRSVSDLGVGARVEDGPTMSPLVGRDEVMAILDEVWAQSTNGRGRAVLIEGPAGIGKSMVLREFEERVESAGGVCLQGGGSGGDAGVPAFWPWVQIVRKAHERFPALADHPSTPALAAIDPSLSPDRLSLGDTDPVLGRTRLYRAVIDLLAFARDQGPVVVLLDDAHWLDAETAGLLSVAVPELVDRGVLFGFGVRSDEDSHGRDLPALLGATRRDAVVRLRLRTLEVAEVAEVVRRISGAEPDPVVLTAISDRTGGNPLFVSELARLLVSEGRLDVVGVGELLPPEVRSVLRRRTDRLPVNARTVLVILAIFGRTVPLDLLVRVSQMTEDAVIDACEASLISGLLIENDAGTPSFRLSHDLVRQTLVESVSPGRRVRWHARIGEALQAEAPLPPDRVLEVAEHLTKAATLVGAGAAVPFLVAAADDALARLALQQAEHILTDALVLIDQMPDAAARVAAEHRVKGRLAVARVYRKGPVKDDGSGLELPGDEAPFTLDPADPTSWWASMTLAVALGAYERMEQEARIALRPDLPADAAAMVHLGMGLAQFELGRTAAARENLEHAQALIDGGAAMGAVTLSLSGGAVQNLLGILAHFRGEEEAADTYLARAEDEAADAPPRQVVAMFGAAWLAAYREDRDRCARYADACAKVGAEMDYPAYVAMGQMLGGWARAMSGAPAAVDAFDAAYERYVSDGTLLHAPVFLTLRAEAHAFFGDVDSARRLVGEARSISAATGERCLGPRLTGLSEELAGPLAADGSVGSARVPLV